ncbi:MAG TPA: AAA family ATPase [Casimicrobiaceae bacterium]
MSLPPSPQGCTAARAGDPATTQARLVEALRARLHPGAAVRVIETHISYVLLTGSHAYKIKKAIRLAFLDFSTLAARRFYCEQELRLNRRHAPALYLDVVAITGTVEQPGIGGAGPILEYAVRMLEFPQDALLSSMLGRGVLAAGHIDRLAAIVAAFHRSIAAAAANGPFGSPEDVLQLAVNNFAEIRPLLPPSEDLAALDALEAWTRSEHASRHAALAARREAGFVRECHGDLHLGNIALVDGDPMIFDCIEFNDRMRWIDVMSEVAFTVMDLAHRGRPDLAHRFLDAYLESSGDYAGVAVLRFYLVYRAMVRAKVACLRAAQLPAGAASAAAWNDYRDFVRLAAAYVAPAPAAVIVTHGFAGCGKTTQSQALLERLGAIRIRTDVERKRLHGLGAHERSRSRVASDLYAGAVTRTTYHYVASLARAVAGGGWLAIVDATFLARWQRDLFRDLAAELQVPFLILDVTARERTLRERLLERARRGNDASEAGIAVLEHQLRTHEPLAGDERADVVACDGERPPDDASRPDSWRTLRERLAGVVRVPARASARGRDDPAASLAAKVAFLVRPDSYAEGTSHVDAVETHLSWVFLTERHAWKLKKPLRTADVDLRDIAARLQNGIEEVRLNRRLTSGVYLGVLPLLRDGDGRLSLTGDGEVVDWLVQMRRLPAARMFDRLLLEDEVRRADVDAIVGRLCGLYRQGGTAAIDCAAYRGDLAANLAAYGAELRRGEYALPLEQVDAISARLSLALSQQSLFDARVQAGHVVEGHGDLRPEHICLESQPQIIDCLEFSRRLRTLDPADELGFLALECERLGAPQTGTALVDAYREQSGDAVPPGLVHFYQGYRACVRATLAFRHLHDPAAQAGGRWIERARHYLDLASAHAVRCTS